MPATSDVLVEVAKAGGLLGGAVAAVFGFFTHRKTKGIDDAVNRRHEKGGPEAPKLYDLALENRASIRHLRGDVTELHGRVDGIGARLDRHIDRSDWIVERVVRDPFAEGEAAPE